MSYLSLHSPVGDLTLHEEGGALVALEWGWVPDDVPGRVEAAPVLHEARIQMNDYFDGKRGDFDLPVAPRGTPFQQAVWRGMCAIPAGQTRTYGDLAGDLESSAQAVGTACGANPIAIIIPCHRIVAAAGLGGYSGFGGVTTKVQLLRLEGVAIQDELF
jgi:methylated-DNA-[protein]-cysteine S-methyltransferase